MAKYSIISKDGSTVKATGAPVYYGTYLKPGYLEFGEIGSPTPISLEAGDYVDYNRTGLRYKLYNTPKVTKQGERNLYGGSFVYENVQFFDATKELEIAPFVDLVPFDNLIHFSTRNTVSFYGTPANVAERIQACLDYWFPSSLWEVVIVSGLDSETDAELIETLATETEFSVSGVSCLGALDQIYEKWNGLGWSYSYSGGRNRIVIGAPNKRTSANITTTYGRIGDNGLVTIARSVSNADNMGTRLYAYGSMRNMPTDYYRSKGIKDAESVDIEHLMIPINGVAGLDYNGWGRTDDLPDARLAYIENASAIAKHGLIPRYAYFDGSDNNYPEIFPSISGATIGDVIDGKAQISDTSYVPSLSVWNRADRIDEIVSAINPDDDGGSSSSGVQYDESSEDVTDASIIESNGNPFQEANIGDYAPTSPANKLHAVLNLSGSVTAGAVDHVIGLTATVRMIARSSSNEIIQVVPIDIRSTSTTGRYEFVVEDAVFDIALSGMTGVSLIYTVETSGVPGDYTFNILAGEIFLGWSTSLEKTFKVTIPQIGFNILQYADLGGGKKISMIDGMCAARDFPIKAASYVRGSDSWSLTLGRIKDSETGLWYPNTDYQIAPGDRYVLLGIAMPELYISMASIRLLKEAKRLLENISSESPFYEPGIDSKKVLNENRILREGMWMHLYGDEIIDGGEDYALIDTLRIDEGASNIPVYEVSLRKRKPIEWTETISGGGSPPSSSPVESESQGSSSPQPSLDWFISETYEENGETKYRLKLNPKYQGMYAEGWVSAGGLSDGGGSTPTGDYLPLSGGTMTGPISMAVTSSDLTIAESFRFTYNDSVVGSLRASSGGAVGLYANGSIRLRPGGSISNGLVITTTDVTFNGTSLLNGGGSYTLPAATTDALGGVKVSAVETGTARVITTLYGNRYGLKIDADGKAYIDIPSPGTTVSWGNTSNNVSPLTVNGMTKSVLLSGWAPDLSGYLPLTAGSSKPLTGPLNIKLPGSENTYYDYLLFRNSDNTEVASMRVTGVGHIGLHATQAIEFMAGNTRRFTVSGTYGLYPEINGTITLTSAGAFSSLGDGYDIGRRNTSTTSTSNSRFIRAVRSRMYYLTDDVYIYYDTVNNCIRTNAPIVSDSYISAGGVSTT